MGPLCFLTSTWVYSSKLHLPKEHKTASKIYLHSPEPLAYIKWKLAARSWETPGEEVLQEAPADPERSFLLCRRSEEQISTEACMSGEV